MTSKISKDQEHQPALCQDTYRGMRSRARIGRSLRAARQNANLTQAELAEKSGVSRVLISEVENGHRTARIETLNAMLYVLGYHIAFVPHTPGEQRLIRHLKEYSSHSTASL